jgi:D-amino-acid dehydrogenase
MRVAVIGAGVVGVTTAYELAAEGHDVVVFERRGGVAAEASFGHAGVVSSGHIAPWAAPGLPLKLLRDSFRAHATMRLRSGVNAAALGWLWKWSRACRPAPARANRLRLQRLAAFSRVRLHRLTRDLNLDYERAEGVLVLLRTPGDLALARPTLKLLAEGTTKFKLLDAQRCRVVEPGLNPEAALHAGIYLPDDEVANCRQFSMLLRQQAHRRGVEFRLHTEVLKLVPGRKPQVIAEQREPEEPALQSTFGMPLDTDDGERGRSNGPTAESFDAVVLCCALGAPALLRPHGVHLPVQSVHGYSVTAPLRHLEAHPDHGPRAGLIDETHQVAISRIGSRVRVSGGAEIGGALSRHHPAALASLYKVLDDWFPGVARLGQAQPWKGARAMLPDGPPVLGASGIDGVWLNLGHGDHGWTLACGSARLLAETMSGRAPSIDVEGLGVERLRR